MTCINKNNNGINFIHIQVYLKIVHCVTKCVRARNCFTARVTYYTLSTTFLVLIKYGIWRFRTNFCDVIPNWSCQISYRNSGNIAKGFLKSLLSLSFMNLQYWVNRMLKNVNANPPFQAVDIIQNNYILLLVIIFETIRNDCRGLRILKPPTIAISPPSIFAQYARWVWQGPSRT